MKSSISDYQVIFYRQYFMILQLLFSSKENHALTKSTKRGHKATAETNIAPIAKSIENV